MVFLDSRRRGTERPNQGGARIYRPLEHTALRDCVVRENILFYRSETKSFQIRNFLFAWRLKTDSIGLVMTDAPNLTTTKKTVVEVCPDTHSALVKAAGEIGHNLKTTTSLLLNFGLEKLDQGAISISKPSVEEV